MFLLAGVVAAIYFLLRWTRFGFRVYAVGGDEEVSRLSGLRTHRTIIAAHVVCSVCAALTGLFLASRLGSGTPTVGIDGGYDLESIAAVVLGGTALAGGRGGVLGTVGGVLILAVLDNMFNQLEVNAFLKDVVRGVIIIAAVAVYARGSGSADMSTATAYAPTGSRGERVRKALIGTAPIFLVLLVLLVWIAIVNPNFLEPPVFLSFLKRAAPLVILAAGQYFVIVSGEFDLSVGSLVTVVVVVAARLIDDDPSRTWPVIALLLAIGVGVGFVNGFITTRLRVPSFITTLGMLLILSGAVFLWTGGAPRGALADNFREIGRLGIEDFPVLEQLPWSVLIMLVLGAGAVFLMRADVGAAPARRRRQRAGRAAVGRAGREHAHDRVRPVRPVGRDRRHPARRLRRRVGPGRRRAGVRGDHRGRARRGRPRGRPGDRARRDGGRAHARSALHAAQPPGRLRRAGGHGAGSDHHRRRRVRLVPLEGCAMNGAFKDPRGGLALMRRNLALCAMVSLALFAGACGTDDSENEAAQEPAATEEAAEGDHHGRAVGVLRPGGLRPPARAAHDRGRGA